ncbi:MULTISPECIES: hypothetical protein [Pseudomonadaceae]|uniref:Uncharacterized protein n=1 Tax=Pseudomonas denitrificans TaxID=43306 RepID=A0A9X7R6D7_PSEDE|nr:MULTISPECIES: hypothetical protein [Pseudomonadaceae]MBD9515069.1 hypothetical protein [Pseudomonas sp. PDM22]MBD9685924.1 hypothetical protein [Pseudomonas sp. PDM20]OQR32270.1 hypothetical protein BWR15_20430 [Pseudomonas sp. T]QEY74451.1 hypothetical protein F1C79_24115 [Pseudomonas denitrificans (nom. rej.)]
MNHNPFSTPHAELTSPQLTLAHASHQTYLFIAAQIVATICLLGVNLGLQWFTAGDGFHERMTRYLPVMISTLLGGMLAYVAGVLLLVQQQRERHAIGRFRPLPGLLLAYGFAYLVCSLAMTSGIGFVGQVFYEWVREQGNRQLWIVLYAQLAALASLLLTCVLPLWLILRLARGRALPLAPGAGTAVARWQVALGMALCVAAVVYRLSSSLAASMMTTYSDGNAWQPLFQLINCAVPFAIVMVAVHTRLPPQLSRFGTGRVLIASLVLLLLWLGLLVLCALVLVFVLADALDSRYLPLAPMGFAALLLSLLWPLSRLCVRWFFADELAQSSPK